MRRFLQQTPQQGAAPFPSAQTGAFHRSHGWPKADLAETGQVEGGFIQGLGWLTTEELRYATKDLDAPEFRPRFLKPTRKQKSLLSKFMTKVRRGRPPTGEGAEKIYISLEKGLLREADQFARQRGQSRSGMIAEALRSLMNDARRKAG